MDDQVKDEFDSVWRAINNIRKDFVDKSHCALTSKLVAANLKLWIVIGALSFLTLTALKVVEMYNGRHRIERGGEIYDERRCKDGGG